VGWPKGARAAFATDALGQKGRSSVETFLLPERVFNDPTARALIILRKQLTRDPKALRLDVADGMRMIQGPSPTPTATTRGQLGPSSARPRSSGRLQADDHRRARSSCGTSPCAGRAAPMSDAEKQLEQARQICATAIQRQAATRRSSG
jgi:hypothetical protein